MSRRRSKRKKSDLLPEIAQPEQRVPRRLRVEGQLHQALVVGLRELRDPRVVDVSVTRVEMTDDLQLARIHVRHATSLDAASADTDATRLVLMQGLRAAANRLRRHVGSQLALRYTPELRFMYDEGLDAAARVDELLAEIHHEAEQRAEESPSSDDDESDEEMV